MLVSPLPEELHKVRPLKRRHATHPNAPLAQVPPAIRTNLSQSSSIGSAYGFLNRGTMAALIGLTGISTMAPMAHAQESLPAPTTTRALADAIRDLERKKDLMSPEELNDARKALWKSYLEVAGTTADPTASTPSAGGIVVRATLEEIEHRMEITPYDLAHPGSYTPIDGMSGYKEISGSELKTLLVRMVRSMPLNEVPGGTSFLNLVKTLPNTDALNGSMSFDEVTKALPASQRPWLTEQFGPFLKEHKIETILVGAAAITGIRAASPSTAGVLDHVIPRIKVWSHNDGALSADAALRYRDRRVLPDLDLSGAARRNVGPVMLRATGTATIAPEASHVVTGTASVGARIEDTRSYLDLSASYNTERHTEVRLDSGYVDHDSGLVVDGAVVGRFGPHTAVGDASGRVTGTISLDKRFRVGRDSTGSFGVYGETSVDTDGSHPDTRVGVLFKLSF